MPLWISCLFTICTALFGGRNKPNYLTKVQQDANGTFTGCSSILWLNIQQLSFLIPSGPSWVISLYFYPSQRSLALSPQKRAKKLQDFLNVTVSVTLQNRYSDLDFQIWKWKKSSYLKGNVEGENDPFHPSKVRDQIF